MRAAIFRGSGRALSIENIPDPTPGLFEVIIQVARCGICGTDLHMTADEAFSYPLGATLGHEYAGMIVGLGRKVTGVQVGDRVTAQPIAGCGDCDACLSGELYWCDKWRSMMGGFAEYTVADARSVAKLPDSVSLADAALVEPLAAALNGVQLSGCKKGDRVLVIGAGALALDCIFGSVEI
jgi:(R,R)-butanediol dehydrogenase/meso-butanediol dehydrogenase/diacetyl reductase